MMYRTLIYYLAQFNVSLLGTDLPAVVMEMQLWLVASPNAIISDQYNERVAPRALISAGFS